MRRAVVALACTLAGCNTSFSPEAAARALSDHYQLHHPSRLEVRVLEAGPVNDSITGVRHVLLSRLSGQDESTPPDTSVESLALFRHDGRDWVLDRYDDRMAETVAFLNADFAQRVYADLTVVLSGLASAYVAADRADGGIAAPISGTTIPRAPKRPLTRADLEALQPTVIGDVEWGLTDTRPQVIWIRSRTDAGQCARRVPDTGAGTLEFAWVAGDSPSCRGRSDVVHLESAMLDALDSLAGERRPRHAPLWGLVRQ